MMNDTIDVLDTINSHAISSINHADYTKRNCSLKLVPTDSLTFFIITKVTSDWQLQRIHKKQVPHCLQCYLISSFMAYNF